MITPDKIRDGIMTLSTMPLADLFVLACGTQDQELKDICAMELEARHPFNWKREK